jgi:hypothetical protein
MFGPGHSAVTDSDYRRCARVFRSIDFLTTLPFDSGARICVLEVTLMKRFAAGLLLGIVLTASVTTLVAQNERALHPRIAKAIEALRDAKAYMEAAPHDFGGHRVEAIRATDDAIRQLNLALAYRAGHDARGK